MRLADGYFLNLAVLLMGTILSVIALVVYTSWPFWTYVLATPLAFLAWHLLVERVFSGIINRFVEEDPWDPN